MENMQTIGNRIKELRKELGLTQEAFGKKIYREKSIISKIENDEVELSSSMRLAICSVFGIREEWILTGEGPKKKDELLPGGETPRHQIIPAQADFPADDFVFIRQVNGKISAGGGLMPDDSIDVQAAFRKDWIKRKGGKPNNMSLIRVDGDSMDPILLSGDLVLVDHGRNSISSRGGIYAIVIDDEIMIKRVQPVFPDKILVLSDNKQYPPFEIARNEVAINGKVIWYARELER
jgi:phage repressor protein C with HTH and peptisase S24 domain